MFFLASVHCEIVPLKLRCLRPPQDDLLQALFSALHDLKSSEQAFELRDGDILFLSAKVVAIHQGRCLDLAGNQGGNSQGQLDSRALVAQEADYYIPNTLQLRSPLGSMPSVDDSAAEDAELDPDPIDFPFTLKGQTPVPFAGVDVSNGDGWHILWPEKLEETADLLRKTIISELGLTNLGLVIADSTVFPLRRGCIGISIAASGLQLLHSYLGQDDLFGRKLKLSESNIIDRLTSFATLFMGEGSEQTPAVVLRGLEQYVVDSEDFSNLFIDPEQDFYRPLFK